MKASKRENLLLFIIKYGPIFFVIITSFITTKILLEQEKSNHKIELETIKQTYLEKNKQRVKEEVQEVYKLITKEKNQAERLLKKEIKERVYEAHNIASSIYNSARDDRLYEHLHSKEHVFQTIKSVLGSIIYNNGRGYYFIDDINGVKHLQPLNKSFEGVNLSEYEDAKGYNFVKKIKETIRNKTEAYDSYYWYKPNDDKVAYKKISFYKYFEPYNVAIGTGEYVKDFEKELQDKLLNKIKNIRYGDNGYIFIYDLKGNCLSHYKKEFIGTNRLNYTNKDGVNLTKKVIEFAKVQKAGFTSYNATLNPSNGINSIDSTSKISYVKLLEDWNWVIGTGFYLDSLKEEIRKKEELLEESEQNSIRKIIYISAILTLLFIVLSFMISKYLEKIFKTYKINLNKETEEKIEQEKMLVQQSKMATMGEMIGNIAHQWKQPLNLISMSNGLIKINQDMKDFSSKEEIDDAIENIDVSVQHLSTTIDDFRNFFKPEKEKKEYDLEYVFEKTFKLINSQFKNNNIEIVKEINNSNLYGYPNELLQVLINIIKNARDELVNLEKEKDRVLFITSYENNDKVYIEIKDNAGGVSEKIIDKIFDRYFTTKKDDEGTGIGLYMSKQIIEGMNGQITVENQTFDFKGNSYKGALFTICLTHKFK